MEVDESADLNEFLCAFDTNHYIDGPMSLTCGHFACNQCLNDYKKINGGDMVKCELCQKEYKIDFGAVRESTLMKKMISLKFPELIKELAAKFENQLVHLRRKIDDDNENFHLHIEYAKDEIEIRVESLKIELDKLMLDMIKKLSHIQEDFKENQIKMNYEYFDNNLKILNEKIKRDDSLNEETFVDIRKKEIQLQQHIECMEAIPLKIDLTLSNEKLEEKIIGKINYSFKSILKELNNDKFKKIDLDFIPRGLCCISDNQLLVSDVTNKCLKLYDENFKLIKTIDKINNISISPYDITTDRSSRIYISSRNSDMILALDINLNLVKRIGDEGNRDDQFNDPLGLDLSGDSLYVCDSNNQRIQKFTKDLVFEKSYPLQFKPWMIKVINNYALIRPNGEPNILSIYNLEPKMKIINKISGNHAISKNEFGFYIFLHSNKFIQCYDVKGDLVDEIKIVFPEEVDISDLIVFFDYNNALVISCATAKSLVNIK